MKHKSRCKYTICHMFKATKSVLLLNTCFKENRDFFIHCKARNTTYGIRLMCTICVRKKDISNNNTPKVGWRACHGVSEISESWCCLMWSSHQVQTSESRLAHSSQPWTGCTMPEPEVVKFSKSRNELLMLLETRENNRSLRQLPLLNVDCFLIKCRQNQMMSEEFLPCATLEIVQETARNTCILGSPSGFLMPIAAVHWSL